ncbi:MAG: hypothetical protein AB8B56_19300 [Crocinitomicaceae bacterium]
MKYWFLLGIIAVVSCAEEAKNTSLPSSEIVNEKNVIYFEGLEYSALNDSIYQRNEDDYQTIITLYPNGEVYSVEHQGEFQSCSVSVDTSRYFSNNGGLIREVYHRNRMPGEAVGCHESVQEKHITEYYENGSVKRKRAYSMTYLGSEQPSDIWQEFNEDGALISTINYGNPFQASEVLDISFIEELETNWDESDTFQQLANEGFVQLKGSTSDEKGIEFYHRNHKAKLIVSKTILQDRETIFLVEYSVNRNQLNAFEERIKQEPDVYVYHGFAADAYFKSGLGTYRTKKIELDQGQGLIRYTHRIRKASSLPSFSLHPIER